MAPASAAIELDGQYRLLREEAGTVVRAGRGKLVVHGPDAADYLQGQLTNEIEALAPGAGCYAALLDRKGRMQSDMRVLRLSAERIWLDTEAVSAPVVSRHLGLYRVGREVELDEVTERHEVLSLIGPATEAILGAPPPLAEHDHDERTIAGVAVRVVRTDGGADLICDAAHAEAVRAALEAAGAPAVSEAAAEVIRVEAGRPRFGAEMTTDTIPQEAGINDRAVSFTKGCYIGQETVARLHYKGKPNRHLRGLRAAAPVSAGDPIACGDRVVGLVGTAVLSPARGPLALAIVRREAEPGARVAIGEAAVEAEVVELPFP